MVCYGVATTSPSTSPSRELSFLMADLNSTAFATDHVGETNVPAAYIYLDALGLALSSSTDNFAVGASLGIAGLRLQHRFNLAIAAANSCGALLATEGGQLIGQVASSAGPWIAAAVFFYLSWQEGASLWRGEPASPLLALAEQGVAMQVRTPNSRGTRPSRLRSSEHFAPSHSSQCP